MWQQFCKYDFQTHHTDWYQEHFQGICPHENATGLHWWWVNIDSGNGLVPSGRNHCLEPCWSSSVSPYDVTRGRPMSSRCHDIHIYFQLQWRCLATYHHSAGAHILLTWVNSATMLPCIVWIFPFPANKRAWLPWRHRLKAVHCRRKTHGYIS